MVILAIIAFMFGNYKYIGVNFIIFIILNVFLETI